MPDKSPDAFRTISEVADWLGVQPHVLRFWESKFSQVRPIKRAGGRRYYRPNDMLLLGGIRKLLHEDGLTIKGAQKVLREEGMAHVARMSQPLDPESAALSALDTESAAEAAEELELPSTSAEPETAQVLNFDSAQRVDPEQTPAPEDDPQHSGHEMPGDEGALQSRPDLSGTPPPRVEPEGDPERPLAATEEDQTAPGKTSPKRTAEPDDEADEPSPKHASGPSFLRSSSKPQVSEPEPSATGEKQPQAPSSERLPSFLQEPPDGREPAASEPSETASAPARDAPSSAHETDGEPEPPVQTEAQDPEAPPSPKPRVVHVPDPDDAAMAVSSGALSACYSATRLTVEQRAEVLPLVSQLAALRDRMATPQGR